MQLWNTVSLNITMLLLLSIVLYIAVQRLDVHNRFNKIFLLTCVMVLHALVLEVILTLFYEKPYSRLSFLIRLLYAVLFSITPVLAYFWPMFSGVLTGDDSSKIRLVRPGILVPAVILVLMSAASIYWNLIYYVDDQGIYYRGPLFFLVALITDGYMFYSAGILVWRRKRLFKNELYILLAISLLPLFGGMLQAVFYGTLLMWGFTSGALIVMYVYLQERMIQIDVLTGAWTRRSLQQHFTHYRNTPFYLFYMDLDDFKKINDRFGHLEGDRALREFSRIMQGILREGDIFARMGGDEFILVSQVRNGEDPAAVVKKIHSALEAYNEEALKPYVISCSVGAMEYDGTYDLSIALDRVDEIMYA